MKLVTESTVFSVSCRVEMPSPPSTVQLVLRLNNLASKERIQERYVLDRALVDGLGLDRGDKREFIERIRYLLTKYRRRFADNRHGQFIELRKNDIAKFQPLDLSYTAVDSRIARLLYSHFLIFPQDPLVLGNLNVSIEASDELIRERLKFFEKFEFITIEDGDPVKIRPRHGVLDNLKHYTGRFEEGKDFAEGKEDAISGQKEVSRILSMPVEYGARCQHRLKNGQTCPIAAFSEEGLCELHHPDPKKSAEAFLRKLDELLADDSLPMVDLSGVVFPDSDSACNFRGDHFGRRVVFSECKFWGEVIFENCLFDEVEFSNCEFFSSSKFINCIFRSAIFEYIKFHRRVSFSGSRFRDEAAFTTLRFDESSAPSGSELDFGAARISNPDHVEFRDINMGSLSLGQMNVQGARMHSLRWPTKGWRPFWQRHCFVNEQKIYQSAALYRDIQSNYKNQGDYFLANSFYVSEKEMERLQKGPVCRTLGLRGCYRWLSNCGQSIVLPLLWLLAIILPVFTLLLLLFGGIDSIHFSIPGSVPAFIEAYLKNFAMLFNRSLVIPYLEDLYWSQALHIVETGIALTLLSLVVVAARRRFRSQVH